MSLSVQSSMHKYLGGAKPFVLFRNVVDTSVFHMKESESDQNLPFAFYMFRHWSPGKMYLVC